MVESTGLSFVVADARIGSVDPNVAGARFLLNSILYPAAPKHGFSSKRDEGEQVLYVLAMMSGVPIGAARLCLDPELHYIKSCLRRLPLLLASEVRAGAITAAGRGVAVVPSARCGILGTHVGVALFSRREALAISLGVEYLIVKSRPSSWGLVTRLGYQASGFDSISLPSGECINARWGVKRL